MPRHLGEAQLPGSDRAEQFFPACDLAAQHIDDDEVAWADPAPQMVQQGGLRTGDGDGNGGAHDPATRDQRLDLSV